jgi:alkanesulfonate monooxygenase SsuD/methylene tetrahydromethanopterin reductase-like flavin-dependent oxidoreductase (luciferase family)
MHSPGYVAATSKEAVDDYFPGFAKAMSDIGRERGWRPMTRRDFEAQLGPEGALIIGDPDEVAAKVIRHSDALGGLSRVTFQMNAASLPHDKLMRAIELIGTQVAAAVRERTGTGDHPGGSRDARSST